METRAPPAGHLRLDNAGVSTGWKGLTEKQEASVRQILESGRRLLALIDHILGISKSHANELSFEASGAPRASNT